MIVLAEVSDGKNAAATALNLTPNLVLFSVSIPSLVDLEQITFLRQQLSTTMILALVTAEIHGQEQTALEYSAHKVLTKAISRCELIDTLKVLV